MSNILLVPLYIIAAAAWVPPIRETDTIPACGTVSHDRLLVRVDRDVCAPTLHRTGRPMAVGFMPTRCLDVRRVYRIDAVGTADRCLLSTSTKPSDHSIFKNGKITL
jgi:hypothetical protein